MRRLTNEEREIRTGRGIPLNRWWPFAVVVLAMFVSSLDFPMLESCAGRFANGGGRAGAAVRLLLAYPCSPHLLSRSWGERLLFVAMWGAVPFVLVNLLWVRRHGKYWEPIRQRERQRRAEKRAQKPTLAERPEAE